MKLQQVEWFAARRRAIAMATRAADRKRMIDDLETAGDPLASEFADASARAQAAAHIARASGEYPLLSGGDVNLYSLFVERAMTLVKPDGMVGLLTPSGIASDKTASAFFKGVATEGRLRALYDFENKKVFFPDVDSRFKFCVLVASPSPGDDPARCAFYCHRVAELDDPDRCFPLTAEDFARVNPNTGTAPIFRTRRDAALTTAIYNRLPVLVDRSSGEAVKAWPVKYTRMFDMTNDSASSARGRSWRSGKVPGPSAAIGSAARPEIGCRSTRVRWSKPSTTGLPTSSSISRTSIGQLSPYRPPESSTKTRTGYRTRSSGFPLRNAAGPQGWSGFSASKRLRHLQTSEH